MESGPCRLRQRDDVPEERIEYVSPDGFNDVDQVTRVRRKTFSAMEIEYLTEHAADYGCHRVGNSWVKDQ